MRFLILLLLAGCASQHAADLDNPKRHQLDAFRQCLSALQAAGVADPFLQCDRRYPLNAP